MKMLKKAVTAVITFALAVSAVSSMACAKDSFMGYDQDNLYTPDAYGKLYYCPEANEVYVNGYAGKVEWKHAYYEADYPFLEVVELYLDDNATGKTRYAGIPDGVTELKPEFWEAKYPYEIYSRLYAGLTAADKATDIIVDSETTENVVGTYDYAGFDVYANIDGVIKNVGYLYSDDPKVTEEIVSDSVASKFRSTWENPTNGTFDVPGGYVVEGNYGVDGGTWAMANEYYSRAIVENPDGSQSFTDEFMSGSKTFVNFIDANIHNYIGTINWLKLAGPDYYTGGTRYVDPMYEIISGKPASWYDNILIMPGRPVQYEWKTVGYESTYPYRYYQVLYIEGVPMDGSEVELVGKWKNEWKFDETIANSDLYDHYQIDRKDKVWGSINVGYDWMTDDVFGDIHVVNRYKLQATADKARLPYIFRYTGGCAKPKVEWKYAFTEAAYPHAIVEELYLDGKPVKTLRYSGENAESLPALDYRVSAPRYYKVNVTSPYAQDILNEYVASNYPLHDYNMIVAGNDYYIPFSATNLYDGHTKIASEAQRAHINEKIASDLGIKINNIDSDMIESIYWWAIDNGYDYLF